MRNVIIVSWFIIIARKIRFSADFKSLKNQKKSASGQVVPVSVAWGNNEYFNCPLFQCWSIAGLPPSIKSTDTHTHYLESVDLQALLAQVKNILITLDYIVIILLLVILFCSE